MTIARTGRPQCRESNRSSGFFGLAGFGPDRAGLGDLGASAVAGRAGFDEECLRGSAGRVAVSATCPLPAWSSAAGGLLGPGSGTGGAVGGTVGDCPAGVVSVGGAADPAASAPGAAVPGGTGTATADMGPAAAGGGDFAATGGAGSVVALEAVSARDAWLIA